jgi:hypothetical protein
MSGVWGEVIDNLLWSLLGLVLGYFLASVRYTHREETTMTAPADQSAPKKSWLSENFLGVVVVVLAVLTVSLLTFESIKIRSVTQCQAEYNQTFNETLSKRTFFTVQTDKLRLQREEIDRQREEILDDLLRRSLQGEKSLVAEWARKRAALTKKEEALVRQQLDLEAAKAKYKYPKIPDCK